MNSRKEFAVAAIAEAQATIRALDVKLAALLVAVLAPIPLLPSIAECFAGIYSRWSGFLVGSTLVVFSLCWALAILCYARAIGAISSPSKHILNGTSFTGSLYGPGLFNFLPIDAILNRSSVISKIDPLAHVMTMPSTPDDIERELAFEHMKLIYIRDIKLLRLQWGFRFSGTAISIGSLLFVVSRYYIKQCGP
jgi:hypothetical protein